MRTLTPTQAATRLGVTDHAVRNMIAAGRLGNLTAAGHSPAAIPEADVDRVLRERRDEALRAVGDEAAYARKIRATLWPSTKPTVRASGDVDARNLADIMGQPSGRGALRLLPAYATQLWGRDVLTAAASKFPVGACAFCYAAAAAGVHESMPPRDSEAVRILLNSQPCTTCRESFKRDSDQRRAQLTRMRQQLQGQELLDRASRVNEEKRQALAAVHQAARRVAAANNAWRRLPKALREGGRS